MAKLSYKVSYYVLYAMFAIILVVLGLFYFGGDAQGDAVLMSVDSEMWHPGAALKSLIGLIVLIVVVVIAWTMGSDEPLTIPGYSGTDNVPFWLKITDMFLYSIYILFAGTVLAIIFSSIKKKLS